MSRALGEEDQRGSLQELHTHLLDAMHAMAQPLTLLQSRLFLASTGESSDNVPTPGAGESESDRAVLAAALNDVEDLCGLFRLMQQLLQVQGTAPKLATTPLARLTDTLAEDAEAVFAGSGVACELSLPTSIHIDSSPMVTVDLVRTRQAALAMMVVVREVAKASDQPGCTLSVELRPGCLELTVAAGGSVFPVVEGSKEKTIVKRLSEEARLHIALAKANALSQRGAFAVELAPFALTMSLPLAICAVVYAGNGRRAAVVSPIDRTRGT